MKGTAILFQEDNEVMVLEDVDRSVYEEIKKQVGCKECFCEINNKQVSLGKVSPIIWHEDEIDWDYGY